jgi:hypothetical protein
MKKLAIYYGWPSLVRGSNNESAGSLDDAINRFLRFDIVILGAGLESPNHADHSKTKQIINALKENNKEAHGYIHLAVSNDYQCFSEDELEDTLLKWKEMGMNGVFYDLMDPAYNASMKRVERIVKFAHTIGLGIFYNTNFDSDWLDKRVIPFAQKADIVLIEPFGTSWEKLSYTLPERLPPQFKKLQAKGVPITGVSTYNSDQLSTATQSEIEIMMSRFLHYSKKAEELGLAAYQFTNGVYSSYGKDANVLFDFNS